MYGSGTVVTIQFPYTIIYRTYSRVGNKSSYGVVLGACMSSVAYEYCTV